MSHRSARTTFLGRLLIVQHHQAGWPQAHIAAAMGIGRKCVKSRLSPGWRGGTCRNGMGGGRRSTTGPASAAHPSDNSRTPGPAGPPVTPGPGRWTPTTGLRPLTWR